MNTEELKESLYRKGFGESLNAPFEEQIKSGKPEFQLEHAVKIGEDDVNFKLHFRRDEERDKVEAYKLNVAGYILKPVTLSAFVERMAALNKYWVLNELP